MATNNNGINTEEEEKKINPTENYDKVTSNPVDPTKHTTAAKGDGFSYGSFKATGVAGQTESLAQKYLGMNYTDFTKGTDYQSLAKRYSDNGRKAMDDTMGMLAARTGGLASSYATVAGQQTYNDYMTKLEDAARALYDSQRAEARDNYDLAQGMYDRQLSQYNTDKSFAYGQYRDNVTDAQWMDNANYGAYMDAVAGAQWKDGATTNQNNIDKQGELDTIYNLASSGGEALSWEEYLAQNPGTLLSQGEYEAIVSGGTYQYGMSELEKESTQAGINNTNANTNATNTATNLTLKEKEEDTIRELTASGGTALSWEEYLAENPGTLLTRAEYESAVTSGGYAYSGTELERKETQANINNTVAGTNATNTSTNLMTKESAQDEILAILKAGGTPPADLITASGWTQETIAAYTSLYTQESDKLSATEAYNKLENYINAGISVEEIKGIDSGLISKSGYDEKYWKGMATERNRGIKDTELGEIFAGKEFLWGDWDGDGKVGEADTDGEVDKDGNPLTFDDVYGGSSYNEQYWESYYNRIQNGYVTEDQAKAQNEVLSLLQVGGKPTDEQYTATGWDQATRTAYESYFENAKLSDTAKKAIEKLENYIAVGYSVDDILAMDGGVHLIADSGYDEDYWDARDKNSGFTQSELEAQEDIMTMIQSGDSYNEYNSFIKSSGRSAAYWQSYEQIVNSGSNPTLSVDQCNKLVESLESIVNAGGENAETVAKSYILNAINGGMDSELATDLFVNFFPNSTLFDEFKN